MISNEIKEAVQVLKRGGIVIFPTDTAYGIGCRLDNQKAVKRLFQIRKRPKTQAMPVLVNNLVMAEKYSKNLTLNIKQLMKEYWPGALTIVVSANMNLVSKQICGGGQNIGLRIPNHSIPLTLIKELGVPVLGPSANFHGQPTPYAYHELNPQFSKLADYIILGNCPLKQVSTVIDVTSLPWQILRQGAVVVDYELDKIKRQAILLIDTSDNKQTKVGLIINNKKYYLEDKISLFKAQNSLPLINEILIKHHLALKDLRGIQVNPGPGSFTGLRIGLAIANTLAYVLKISVNQKKIGQIELPKY